MKNVKKCKNFIFIDLSTNISSTVTLTSTVNLQLLRYQLKWINL